MHETCIAESIIEVAELHAREANSPSVQVIKLRLGLFTTVVREALEFAFEASCHGTLAENARLEIEVVPMVVECVVCDALTQPVTGVCLICTQCGFPLKIISGEELQIEYIEIETTGERSKWKECQFKRMS